MLRSVSNYVPVLLPSPIKKAMKSCSRRVVDDATRAKVHPAQHPLADGSGVARAHAYIKPSAVAAARWPRVPFASSLVPAAPLSLCPAQPLSPLTEKTLYCP